MSESVERYFLGLLSAGQIDPQNFHLIQVLLLFDQIVSLHSHQEEEPLT